MKISNKKFVKISYIGKLDDGTIFDKTTQDHPFEFIYGEGMIIPGFESRIKDLGIGDKKTIKVPSEEAYGKYNEQAIQEIPKNEFPKDMLKEGLRISAKTPYGDIPAVINEIKEDAVVLDFNHPLAGKDLTFEIEVLDVRDANDEDYKKFNLNKNSKNQ